MTEPTVEKSLMCTQSEESTYTFVCNHIQMQEPCSVMGIIDMGKHILFRESVVFAEKIAKQSNGQKVIAYEINHLTTPQEISDHVTNLAQESKLIVIAHIASGVNIDWFVDLCQRLRNNKGPSFNILLISDLAPLHTSFVTKNKLIMRSLLRQYPFDKDDSHSLTHSFESRFSHTIDQNVKERIFDLSGGGAGLIKSLFLLTKTHDLLNMSYEEIMQDTSIQYRLEALKNDIPEPIRKRLDAGIPLEDEDKKFLTLFGVLKEDGSLFSPLLEKYINKTRDPFSFIIQSCTSAEKDIIELLQNNIDRPVSRDQIAQSLWGADWEDEYSDWAIDQAIHRLRCKLRDSSSPYSFTTKKGVGFILRKD